MCISRFEEETRDAFLDLYTKIDESTLDENGEIVGAPTPPSMAENSDVPVDDKGEFKSPF